MRSQTLQKSVRDASGWQHIEGNSGGFQRILPESMTALNASWLASHALVGTRIPKNP